MCVTHGGYLLAFLCLLEDARLCLLKRRAKVGPVPRRARKSRV
ncbi:hypothetical protein AK972_0486 [Pseudomonas yamanorum]|nr:hypothetical protein AK972_0486 [Pseudomonas yamanorum]